VNIITEEVIEKRLREAVSLRRVVTSIGSHSLEPHLRGHADLPEHEHTVGHIADALSWFDWLSSDDAALVQARLEGARWKMICFRFGISRTTAYRRWHRALALIASHLND
jgi:hypothetical protein